MNRVSFPGLGLEFNIDPIVVNLFGKWPIHWYGLIIAIGFLLAMSYCMYRADRFGIMQDDIVDMLFFAVPLSIIGARVYYVLFYLDLFRDAEGNIIWANTYRIWDGGLAIYGAVIAAALTLLVFCKVRKLNFLAFADLGVLGLLIGQCVGRWGNFVNSEAYGAVTDLPWRMGVYEWANGAWQYLEVHPTFLYESIWNLIGFLVLATIAGKWRKFDGQIFLSYLLWYGFGRGLIEGLRTDSLYFFHTGIRVSQMLGFVSAAVGAALLLFMFAVKKPDPAQLYVNRKRAAEAAKAETEGSTPDQHE